MVISVLLVQALLLVCLLHWASGRGFALINRTYPDDANHLMIHRYVQTVKEPGSILFGAREERSQLQQLQLMIPEWTGKFTYPDDINRSKLDMEKYRFGLAVTTHSTPGDTAFKATYVFFRLWLIECLILAAGGILWFDKWLLPLASALRSWVAKRKSQKVGASGCNIFPD